jgi:hypothetical protein
MSASDTTIRRWQCASRFGIKSGRLLLGGTFSSLLALLLGGTADAYTFTFDDVYYVSCTGSGARCSSTGASNFAAAFPNYTGGPGFSSVGYYQVLSTTNPSQQWSGLINNGTNNPNYIFKQPGNGSSFGGEYIQNDPNFQPVGLQGTEGLDKLVMSGFSSDANRTLTQQLVDKVYTTSATASFQFYGPVAFGGYVPFTFNSFDLSGSAQNVSFEVRDALNNVLDTVTGINLTTGTTDHVVVNIANAFKVDFLTGSTTPDALFVDNIEINDNAIAAGDHGRSGELLLPFVLAVGGMLFGAKLLERSKRHRSLRTAIPHATA